MRIRSIEVRHGKYGAVSYRQKWFNPALGREDSRTFDTLRDAEKFRAAVILNDGYLRGETFPELASPVSRGGITLAEYAPTVLALSKGSARYKRDTKRDYERHVEPYLGHLSVAEMGWQDIVDWQNRLLAKGYKAKSITTYRTSVLGPVFNRAKLPGGRNEPPLRMTPSPLVFAPHPVDPDPYIAEVLTEEDIPLFFQAAHEVNPDIAQLLLVMLGTGLRWGEIKALPIHAVDLRHGTISVVQVFATGADSQQYVKMRAKSRHSTGRVVPIPDVILDILTPLCTGRKHGDFVFTNPDGNPWPHPTVRSIFLRILKRAYELGMAKKKLTIHGLRHSYLTYLGLQDIGSVTLQKLAGHASVKMVARYTRRLDPSMSKSVRDATGSLLDNVIPIRKSA